MSPRIDMSAQPPEIQKRIEVMRERTSECIRRLGVWDRYAEIDAAVGNISNEFLLEPRRDKQELGPLVARAIDEILVGCPNQFVRNAAFRFQQHLAISGGVVLNAVINNVLLVREAVIVSKPLRGEIN